MSTAIKATKETLEIEASGILVGGKLHSRITGRTHEDHPEYVLGKLAQKAGYQRGEQVHYRLTIMNRH